jgi:hypothetical protein
MHRVLPPLFRSPEGVFPAVLVLAKIGMAVVALCCGNCFGDYFVLPSGAIGIMVQWQRQVRWLRPLARNLRSTRTADPHEAGAVMMHD